MKNPINNNIIVYNIKYKKENIITTINQIQVDYIFDGFPLQ